MFIPLDKELRDYQESAISAWTRNSWRGILAMATGTGKTFTSLEGANRLLASHPEVTTILIAAPFQHLADQWAKEFDGSSIRVVKAYKSSARWQMDLQSAHRETSVLSRPLVILTTYTTLSSPLFISAVRDRAETTFLIADECHYLGSPGSREFLALPIRFRLGLSATPQRHFDESGTTTLMDYFDGVVFEFGLQEAIRISCLTPYEYFPEVVELTADEANSYAELSERVSVAAARASDGSADAEERLKYLLIRRARIVNNAENKLEWLRSRLLRTDRDNLGYSLIYAGEDLFPRVLELIGQELQIPSHSFTGRETATVRGQLLDQFASGELKMLVAMRCLDEGVDVPATRTAYFLASSTNARQYVQRRGRILRKSPGKELATIYDAVVVPPGAADGIAPSANEAGALKSQLARIEEFAGSSRNPLAADKALLPIRLRADLPLVNVRERIEQL